jgi:hypothetical protein
MRRIKTLGLTAIAALALCAFVGVSSASAGYFSVPAGTTNYAGTPSEQYFTLTGGRSGNCTTGSFSGSVSHLDQSLTTEPMPDMSCETSFEGPLTWKMNGCKFTFSPGVEGTGPGTFAIGPAGCGPITLTGKYCTRSIAAQSGSATFTNQSGTVKIDISNAALKTTVAKETPQCKAENISYTGKWTVSAASGTIEVVSSQVGVFLGGSGFDAESYPVALAGGQDPADTHALTLVGGRVYKCDHADLAGVATKSSAELALAPKYTDCRVEVGASKLPATADAGSCGYTINSSGALGVTCTEVGDAIELKVYATAQKQAEGTPLCVYEIAPQSGVTGVALSNFGEGKKRGISLDFGLTGLKYKKTVGTIANCGEKEASAKYDGTTKVTGSIG